MNGDKISLETLHLGDNEFTNVGVKLIADFLESDKCLRKLFLNDNCVDAEAASDISDALCVNCTLKFLCLGNCSIDDEGFKHILSSLSVNRGVESLHVWGNSITDATAEILMEIVENYNPVLNDVLIFGNCIEDCEKYVKVAAS